MAKLSDILADAVQLAQTRRLSTVSLQGGLTIVLDFRDPARQQVRLGRRWPVWPSSTEISTIRRYVDIPPGCDVERGQKGEWNVIAYSWPRPAEQC